MFKRGHAVLLQLLRGCSNVFLEVEHAHLHNMIYFTRMLHLPKQRKGMQQQQQQYILNFTPKGKSRDMDGCKAAATAAFFPLDGGGKLADHLYKLSLSLRGRRSRRDCTGVERGSIKRQCSTQAQSRCSCSCSCSSNLERKNVLS